MSLIHSLYISRLCADSGRDIMSFPFHPSVKLPPLPLPLSTTFQLPRKINIVQSQTGERFSREFFFVHHVTFIRIINIIVWQFSAFAHILLLLILMNLFSTLLPAFYAIMNFLRIESRWNEIEFSADFVRMGGTYSSSLCLLNLNQLAAQWHHTTPLRTATGSTNVKAINKDSREVISKTKTTIMRAEAMYFSFILGLARKKNSFRISWL